MFKISDYPSLARSAWDDISRALASHHQITTLGWQDVATRYRRSVVGAFWLTINKAVLIAAIGLVFGALFGQPMDTFLPYIAVGLIFWGYITAAIDAGCVSFIHKKGIILQVNMPLYTHLMRDLWNETIILGHNIILIPLLMLIFRSDVNLNILYVVPGYALLALNLMWISLVLAVVCTRFRDVTQIVQNIMQVMFYLTPVIWNASLMPDRVSPLVLDLNPFYHLLELVRAPVEGRVPGALSWAYTGTLAVVGWTATLPFYGFFRKRIAYWL
jgi:ABC-type polysaccharide/polyol phosphate export permease